MKKRYYCKGHSKGNVIAKVTAKVILVQVSQSSSLGYCFFQSFILFQLISRIKIYYQDQSAYKQINLKIYRCEFVNCYNN